MEVLLMYVASVEKRSQIVDSVLSQSSKQLTPAQQHPKSQLPTKEFSSTRHDE